MRRCLISHPILAARLISHRQGVLTKGWPEGPDCEYGSRDGLQVKGAAGTVES